MTQATKIIDLQKFTRLPLSVISFADKIFPNIRVTTPHKGIVEVKLKETHYPFFFGSVNQTDKNSQQVLNELYKLEEESIDYLVKQWLDNKQ